MCEGIEGRLGKKVFCSSQKMLMILLLQNIFTLLLCRKSNLVKGQIFLGRLGFAQGHLRSAEWSSWKGEVLQRMSWDTGVGVGGHKSGEDNRKFGHG